MSSTAAAPARRVLSLRARRALWGYLFVAPWLLGFVLLLAWPLLFSLYLSFHEVRDLNGLVLEPVGAENYREAFLRDVNYLPRFWSAVGNLLVDLPIVVGFALGVALLVDRPLRGRGLFRTVFFLPVVIGSAWVVQQLFSQGVGTVALVRDPAELRELLGTYLSAGAAGPLFDLLNRVVFVLWRSGVQILIFVAALQSVPTAVREAARVDGASDWAIFWKVTLPLISPFVLVNVVYTIVDSFTEPFNRILQYIQQVSLTQSIRMGYGSALGWIYLVAVFLLLALVLVWSSRFVHYPGER